MFFCSEVVMRRDGGSGSGSSLVGTRVFPTERVLPHPTGSETGHVISNTAAITFTFFGPQKPKQWRRKSSAPRYFAGTDYRHPSRQELLSLTFLAGQLRGCDTMRSSWRRNLGNVRSFVSNSMGGLRGGSNIASWVVAGTLAYFLWVKPAQDLKREQEERAALAAADPNRYVEKRKPMPDPQQTGLIYGERRKIDRDKRRVDKPEE